MEERTYASLRSRSQGLLMKQSVSPYTSKARSQMSRGRVASSQYIMHNWGPLYVSCHSKRAGGDSTSQLEKNQVLNCVTHLTTPASQSFYCLCTYWTRLLYISHFRIATIIQSSGRLPLVAGISDPEYPSCLALQVAFSPWIV
jgi:hypothetical protein